MLYLDQKRSRFIFMTASTIATATLMAMVHGINAVGVLLATAVINIPVYYALPERNSRPYRQNIRNHLN